MRPKHSPRSGVRTPLPYVAAAFLVIAAVCAGGCLAGAAADRATAGGTAALPPLSLSPTGSDANPCTQPAPCLSFERAYHAARPGQVVEVAAGSYGDQTVTPDAAKTSKVDVVFRPAVGAAVTVGTKPPSDPHQGATGLTVTGAKHVTFRNMTILGDVLAVNGAEDVTFQSLLSPNGMPGVYAPTRDITFRGGNYGNTLNYDAQIYPAGDDSGAHNYNFTIDGATLHDVRSEDLGRYHVECMLISDAIGLVVRNLRTYNCDVFDVSLGVFNDGQLSNILIENNMFGSTGNVSASLGLSGNAKSWHGLNVRNNTALVAMRHPDCTDGCTNVRYSGNVSPLPGFYPAACEPAVTYRHNVWYGGTKKCDRSDVIIANPRFVNAGGTPPDLHLDARSPAIGRGDWANEPRTDIDGQPRPQGKPRPRRPRVDAGADQRR